MNVVLTRSFKENSEKRPILLLLGVEPDEMSDLVLEWQNYLKLRQSQKCVELMSKVNSKKLSKHSC